MSRFLSLLNKILPYHYSSISLVEWIHLCGFCIFFFGQTWLLVHSGHVHVHSQSLLSVHSCPVYSFSLAQISRERGLGKSTLQGEDPYQFSFLLASLLQRHTSDLPPCPLKQGIGKNLCCCFIMDVAPRGRSKYE